MPRPGLDGLFKDRIEDHVRQIEQWDGLAMWDVLGPIIDNLVGYQAEVLDRLLERTADRSKFLGMSEEFGKHL